MSFSLQIVIPEIPPIPPPSPISYAAGTVIGDVRVYDIDESTAWVNVQQGTVRAVLNETIWGTGWDEVASTPSVAAGQSWTHRRVVNSSWYDGDHWLQVIAVNSDPVLFTYSLRGIDY